MRQRRIPGGTVWDIVLVGLLLLGVLAALRVAVPGRCGRPATVQWN